LRFLHPWRAGVGLQELPPNILGESVRGFGRPVGCGSRGRSLLTFFPQGPGAALRPPTRVVRGNKRRRIARKFNRLFRAATKQFLSREFPHPGGRTHTASAWFSTGTARDIERAPDQAGGPNQGGGLVGTQLVGGPPPQARPALAFGSGAWAKKGFWGGPGGLVGTGGQRRGAVNLTALPTFRGGAYFLSPGAVQSGAAGGGDASRGAGLKHQ